MGQPALDLPDPLADKPSKAGSSSADDLLAQLAGDEIDRLLAEANLDRSTPPAAEETAAPPAEPESTPLPPSPPDAQVVADVSVAPKPADPQASLDTEATSTSELHALNPTDPAPETEEPSPLDALMPARRTPFYLWPLLWINAPFAALSDSVRDAVGKAAIFLLGAALSLLLYMLVSQK